MENKQQETSTKHTHPMEETISEKKTGSKNKK